MRDLIRPTLVIVARLGLFFTVVAWIIHSRSPHVWLHWNVPGIPADAVVMVNSDGVYSRFYGYRPGFDQMALLLTGDDEGQEDIVVDAFGVKVADDGQDRVILIRHWLLVTFFALFNVLLKWVYRKRGTELEADE